MFPAKLSNAGSLPGDDAVVPGNVNDEVNDYEVNDDEVNVNSGKKKSSKRSANENIMQLMKSMYNERKKESAKRHKENLTAFNRMLDIMDEKL